MFASASKDLFGLSGQRFAQRQNQSLAFGHESPGWLAIGFETRFERLGFPAEDLVHGEIEGRIQMAVVGAGHEMRVGGQNTIKRTGVKVLIQDIDRVGAIEAEGGMSEELVPELLQSDGGGELPGVPEKADHFSVGAETSRIFGLLEVTHDRAAGSFEPVPIRPAADHEAGERLLRIEAEEAIFANSGFWARA